MKKIVIYKDEGADAFCIASLLCALKHEKLDQKYSLVHADKIFFQGTEWQKDTHLVIFPGGRDSPYHEALKGPGNTQIRDFVQKGGKFLGICAGGYYGSAVIEFEQGSPLEILAMRELKFFPGIARGPAYGVGKFCYQSEEGAQIAKLNLTLSANPSLSAAYYNGGCVFVNAEKYDTISVIARYADIKDQPAAIIKCRVGDGCAILSGVHPEYSAYHKCTKKHIHESLFFALKQIEQERRTLFTSILNQLKCLENESHVEENKCTE
jgi:biotin--protein ligase